MFSHKFFYTGCRRHRFAIQRFALFAFIGLSCFRPGLHSETVRGDDKMSALLGQVTQSGAPVASATVEAYEEVIKGGQLQLEMKSTSRTNATGQYSCGGLTAGRYYLFVQVQDRSSVSSANRVSPTPVFAFYYQESDLAHAELVTVHEAQNQVVDIELGSHPAFTIGGRLLMRPKDPALSLLSLGRGNESMPTGLTPSYDPTSGAFTFSGVPPGQYSLLALWHDTEREHSSEVAVTVTDQDIVDLQVHNTGGVQLVFELQPCRAGSPAITGVYLNRADGNLTVGTKFAPVSPGTTNRFDFSDVRGGQYFVGLVGGTSAYVAGTSLGPQGAGNLINVPDGNGSITSEVQVGCEASSLAGRVDTEDGVDRQAYVVLRSLLTGETFQRNANADGNFVFGGIAPGEYRIYAVPATGENSYPSNSLLEKTMGASVTLDPNRTTTIRVPLTQ
jgi:hypothetical protein